MGRCVAGAWLCIFYFKGTLSQELSKLAQSEYSGQFLPINVPALSANTFYLVPDALVTYDLKVCHVFRRSPDVVSLPHKSSFKPEGNRNVVYYLFFISAPLKFKNLKKF